MASNADYYGRDPLIGGDDTLKLRVQLPRGRTGEREPLVVTGQNGAGDFLMVEYLDGQTVRFALDHWGSATLSSEPVRVDFARPLVIEVSMGSLAAPPDVALEQHIRRGRVMVSVDGNRVWEHHTELFTAYPEEVAIGRNPIGGTSCGPLFTGSILSAERVAR